MKELMRGAWLVLVTTIAVGIGGPIGCEDEHTVNEAPDQIAITNSPPAPDIDVMQDGTGNVMRVDLRDPADADATGTNAPAGDGETIRIYQDGDGNRLELRALEEMRRQRAEIERRGL